MSKPDWKEIPEGHNFICQDSTGEWWCFSSEPKPNLKRGWWVNGGIGLFHSTDNPNKDWIGTLEKRP